MKARSLAARRRRRRRRRRAAAARLDLLPWPKVDFAKFGAIETQAAVAHPEDLRRRTCARNWVMIPHVTQFDEADITELEAFRVDAQRGEREGRRQADACSPSSSRRRRGAEEVSRVQRVARRRREPGAQEVLQHRLRRRHAERAGGAGDAGRRKKGVLEIAQRDRRAVGEGARRQARPGRHAGRHASRSQSSAASAAPRSRRSSTRPKWRSSACRKSAMKPVWDGKAVRAAPDAAAVAVVRPPRDRRRRSARASPRTSRRCSPTPRQRCSEDAAMSTIEIKVPDIGDFKDVPIIECW